VRIVQHSLERVAVLAFVSGRVRDLIAACDLPAAVLAEAFEVGDLVVLVLAVGGDPGLDQV
jgi:hypothetical protein